MKRTYQKTENCDHITTAMTKYNKKPAELGAMFGMTGGSTVSKWLKDGHAPKWTLLACEALHRRMNNEGTLKGRVLYVLEVPEEHVNTLEAVSKAVGGTLTEIKRST